MQPHNEVVGIGAVGVQLIEGSAFDRQDSLGWRRVDANRIPEVHDLDADAERGLITRCQLDDRSICAESGNERCRCHADEPVDVIVDCGLIASAAGTGAGGSVLKRRAIC